MSHRFPCALCTLLLDYESSVWQRLTPSRYWEGVALNAPHAVIVPRCCPLFNHRVRDETTVVWKGVSVAPVRRWSLRISSDVGKGMYKSVVQNVWEYLGVGVGGGQ